MSSEDPYFDDENGVLFNKAGITNQGELTRFELAMSLERIAQLRHEPISGNFDEQHLNAMHKHILGDVYEFAGHSRLEKNWDPEKYEDVLDMQSVDYPKCFADCPGEDLQSALEEAFGNLQGDNNLQDLPQEQFIERLALHTTAIWTAHNFREGNTRTTSEFVFQLAKEAGHELPPDFPAEKEEFRDALALASTGDNDRLISQITKAVSPIERAELAIASLTEELVSDELANKPVVYDFESTSTAESKYIDIALNDVLQAKNAVAERVVAILPFEHKRVELEQQFNNEIDNFDKTVDLNKEHHRIALAITVAKHENADPKILSELKRQSNENQKELFEHFSNTEPLSDRRLKQAVTVANDYLDELKFEGSASNDLSDPHLNAGTGEISQNTKLSSASRFIVSERKMVTAHVQKDLSSRAASITDQSKQKIYKDTILNESEKRIYAVRKSVQDRYPDKTALSNELKKEQQTKNNYSELKHLVRKNNELNTNDFQSMSRQRANDNQILYLTNKIEKEPTSKTTLTKHQLQTVQKTRESTIKRQTQERESGLEL